MPLLKKKRTRNITEQFGFFQSLLSSMTEHHTPTVKRITSDCSNCILVLVHNTSMQMIANVVQLRYNNQPLFAGLSPSRPQQKSRNPAIEKVSYPIFYPRVRTIHHLTTGGGLAKLRKSHVFHFSPSNCLGTVPAASKALAK